MAEVKTIKKPVEKVIKKSSKNVDIPKVITPPTTSVSTGSARFINKNLKVSPRKLRLLVNNIKKLDPAVALTNLKFTNSNAGRQLYKCLEDAIASAKYNNKLLSQGLKFVDVRVDEGMKIKRMDKSHGSRFARGIIQKRHSRLTIVLSGTIQS